ncbi:transcriptional activator NhaR [Bermanella marisrubri]|uniref:Transcriptional regulator, LysR family protein n=1 Tax=Bermanella marisrubri TaxID=207949 RepID=Q1N2T2_9GAMM|nr:transcriptional activator NhaR [Bermanella marisrubri]EAT12587.1 transcriptional regulator, LysR family protein [Oceanobacter sp. RED65] [Bermanella marisrubri]QIZ84858.1 transcriptional activator NhaR [Bermanella marisrubri]
MINFKHLHYFWVVAKQGGIMRASEALHITPQTISGQIRLLEEQLGESLFEKSGRNLEITDTGRTVLSYADDIFSLGYELEETVKNTANRTQTLKVGIADVIPKSIAYRLIQPALKSDGSIRLVCKENSLETLLGELALHKLDIVIADGPIPQRLGVKGYSHALGDCGITFLASHKLKNTLTGEFPLNLSGAPFLMPSDLSLVQPQLLQWLDRQHIFPRIVGEFDDSALMKAFGQDGVGVFAVPTAIAEEVMKQYQVETVGQTEEIREQFFAITTEETLNNPALRAINETAVDWLN